MPPHDQIDFARLAEALLDRAEQLVPGWLPGGSLVAGEWVCADLTGGKGRSCSVNLKNGRWADFSGEDRGNDLVSLYAAIHGLDQAPAARELMEQLGWSRAPAPPPSPSARSTEADERPQPPLEDEGAPASQRPKSMWRAILPVPANAPRPDFKHFHRGTPACSWEYRFEGQLHGYVCRFTTSDGGKEIIPLTWCIDESDGRGTHRWQWKQWDDPRPLYVPATVLSADLSLPVVLVEGEKCALAGHELLGHEFDFVSWPGGSKAWAKAHWGWLMGRTVMLWWDCDAQRQRLTREEKAAGVDPLTKPIQPQAKQPGWAAMNGIGSLLAAEHGCTVLACPVPEPGNVPDGWDIADAIAGGWTAENVRAFLRGAKPFVPVDDAVRAAIGAPGSGKSTRSRADAGEEEGATRDEDPSVAWRKHLIVSASGAIKAVRENVVLALDGWPEKGIAGVPEADGLIAFNEFTNNVMKMRDTPWGTSAGVWEEHDELQMGEWLTRSHFLPSMPRSTLEEAVLMVSRRHAFHPVREQVEACRGQWDKVQRLESWLRRCCLEEDEWDDNDPLIRYLALAGKFFVMAMCARVMPVAKLGSQLVRGPGTKFDYMLVFEGGQGVGKSTLAAVLGGDYYADTGLILGEKDSYQNIQGVRVYEWSELDNMSKAEISKVKSFISSSKDRFRASFDRRPKDYPRQVVFVGTTNESHYLSDTTGNRRFWPVQCTRDPDNAWLRENLEQMIAEALVLLDAGERFWPSREEQRDLFNPQQQARTIESSIEAAIRRFLFDEDQKVPHGGENGAYVNEIGMTDLLDRIGYTIDKQTDAVVKRAGAVMHMLGWEVRRTSKPGRPRVYVRPEKRAAAVASGSNGVTRPTQGESQERAESECPF